MKRKVNITALVGLLSLLGYTTGVAAQNQARADI
jgi:hypothetical protein